MKINVYFLTKAREVHRKKVNPKNAELTFRGGIYLLNEKAINFYQKGGNLKGTECFFFEGNSDPVPLKGTIKDASMKYLNDFIYENAIDQTGAISSARFSAVLSWSRDTFTIANIIKYGLLLLIVGTIIGGQLGFV